MLKKVMLSVVAATVLAAVGVIAYSGAVRAEGGGTQQPTSTNGTVTFKVPDGGGTTTGACRTCLTVTKTGRPPLVNGTPGPGQVDGNHNNPSGQTASGAANYYAGVLANAGYTTPADYSVRGGVINFYGVSKLDGGSSNNHINVNGSTDATNLAYTTVTPAKQVGLIRNSNTMNGTITLTGFGLSWTSSTTVTPNCSQFSVNFTASDTAAQVLIKIRDEAVALGWNASIDGDGELVLSSMAGGLGIASLAHSTRYEETEGHTTNDDHWVFSAVTEE